MDGNLDNTFAYDKHIIHLDSINGIENGGNFFSLYFKFDESIKNAVALQLINVKIITPTNAPFNEYDSSFFVILNNIERATSYIRAGNNMNVVKYLEKVEYIGDANGVNFKNSETNNGTSTGSFSDSGTHMFNPPIPDLTRFDLSLKDNTFTNLDKSSIHSVKLTFCIYTIKKTFG